MTDAGSLGSAHFIKGTKAGNVSELLLKDNMTQWKKCCVKKCCVRSVEPCTVQWREVVSGALISSNALMWQVEYDEKIL